MIKKLHIETCGIGHIHTGYHNYWGFDTWLIRIYDTYPIYKAYPPRKEFEKIFEFTFDDLDPEFLTGKEIRQYKIFNKNHATKILKILELAKESKKNIVIHCVAGICRSGAIAEVAEELFDFNYKEKDRFPNTYIKDLLLEVYYESRNRKK